MYRSNVSSAWPEWALATALFARPEPVKCLSALIGRQSSQLDDIADMKVVRSQYLEAARPQMLYVHSQQGLTPHRNGYPFAAVSNTAAQIEAGQLKSPRLSRDDDRLDAPPLAYQIAQQITPRDELTPTTSRAQAISAHSILC